MSRDVVVICGNDYSRIKKIVLVKIVNNKATITSFRAFYSIGKRKRISREVFNQAFNNFDFDQKMQYYLGPDELLEDFIKKTIKNIVYAKWPSWWHIENTYYVK